MNKSKILTKVIEDHKLKNKKFNGKQFDDIQVLGVVFEVMERVKKLTIPVVIVPKVTLFCECLIPEIMGRYTELANVCKCGKKLAK